MGNLRVSNCKQWKCESGEEYWQQKNKWANVYRDKWKQGSNKKHSKMASKLWRQDSKKKTRGRLGTLFNYNIINIIDYNFYGVTKKLWWTEKMWLEEQGSKE